MYLVSACLAGINCRYDGGNSKNEFVTKLVEEGKALPVCPEILGGLETPRVCCEIIVDESRDEKIISKDGENFTNEFIKGARKTLEIAKIIGAEIAILQSRSPSCGYGFVYDGEFSGQLRKGNGFTADLLVRNNIAIYTDNDIEKLNSIINF
ncbi:hypothetical protein U472_15335 [Orenia metallireducens]|uniref:Uncharacterized protein n=1 Tax=Orenia metallireducens TaxID=1413210 RepID=A0A1C0A6F7_9FIRM|nr:DUF523 domain-containing protein [Orenia metallireducens]OCL25699.1 hypothetical protein U472_15335 [Orenia metallireducens]